jgi:hypothetical protein
MGNYPVGHLSAIFIPQSAILLSTPFIVVPLAGDKQEHIVKWVEPRQQSIPRVTKRQHDPDRLERLAQVVDMACNAPEPPAEQLVLPVSRLDRLDRRQAERGQGGWGRDAALEPELLQVRPAAESPTGKIDGGGEEMVGRLPVWVWQAGRGQYRDGVEEGVEADCSIRSQLSKGPKE